jgi:hypothetical protein
VAFASASYISLNDGCIVSYYATFDQNAGLLANL